MVYNDGALYCNNEFVCKKVYTRIFLTLHLHRTKERDLVRDMGGFAGISSRRGAEGAEVANKTIPQRGSGF